MEPLPSIDERFERRRRLSPEAEIRLATDLRTGAEVALKRLRGAGDGGFEVARRVAHPHVLPHFEKVDAAEGTFLSLAYADGGTLGDLRRGSLGEIVAAVLPLVDALATVHEQGLVHRDLKPSNVLRDSKGGIFLTDFELTVPVGTGNSVPLGAGNTVPVGTPSTDAGDGVPGSRFSMSPAQWRGEPAAVADDLYALGVLLYELWVGEPPFWPQIRAADVLSGRVEPVGERRPGLPEAFQGLVAALLDPDPARRPSLVRVREVLERSCEPSQPVLVAPRLRPPSAPRRSRPSEPPAAPESSTIPSSFEPLPSATDGGRFAVPLIVLLGLAAMAVIWGLPRWTASSRPAPSIEDPGPSVASSSEVSESSAIEAADPEGSSEDDVVARRAARKVMDEVEDRLSVALGRGAESWGGEVPAAAQDKVAAGRELFAARAWSAAAASFEGAGEQLDALESMRQERLRRRLAEGEEALESGAVTDAVAAFEEALELEPSSEPAQVGLERARILPRVTALTADGAAAEQRGHWAKAGNLYAEAVALDGEAEDARRALQRVRRRSAESAFSRAMGDGFEMLSRFSAASWDDEGLDDLAAAARRRFEAARSLDGADGRAIDEALAEIGAVTRRHRLEGLRHDGPAHEAREAWREAEQAYRRALKLDPSLRFAQEGLERAVRRAELAESMAVYLERPERLSAAAVLAEARAILVRAEEVTRGEAVGADSDSLHRRRSAELRRLVETYGRAVPGELISDGLTRVWIYKVGKLGTFDRRAVELRPGTYTVTGSRDGFRDVRKEWVIEPGQRPAPLEIRCEEAL